MLFQRRGDGGRRLLESRYDGIGSLPEASCRTDGRVGRMMQGAVAKNTEFGQGAELLQRRDEPALAKSGSIDDDDAEMSAAVAARRILVVAAAPS